MDTARKNFIIAAEDVTTRIGTLKNTILDTGNLKSAEIFGNWAFLHSTVVDVTSKIVNVTSKIRRFFLNVDDSLIFLNVDDSSIFFKR